MLVASYEREQVGRIESVGRRNDLRTRERAASLQALIPATRAEDEKVFFPRGVGSSLTYSESISPYIDEIIEREIFSKFLNLALIAVKCHLSSFLNKLGIDNIFFIFFLFF